MGKKSTKPTTIALPETPTVEVITAPVSEAVVEATPVTVPAAPTFAEMFADLNSTITTLQTCTLNIKETINSNRIMAMNFKVATDQLGTVIQSYEGNLKNLKDQQDLGLPVSEDIATLEAAIVAAKAKHAAMKDTLIFIEGEDLFKNPKMKEVFDAMGNGKVTTNTTTSKKAEPVTSIAQILHTLDNFSFTDEKFYPYQGIALYVRKAFQADREAALKEAGLATSGAKADFKHSWNASKIQEILRGKLQEAGIADVETEMKSQLVIGWIRDTLQTIKQQAKTEYDKNQSRDRGVPNGKGKNQTKGKNQPIAADDPDKLGAMHGKQSMDFSAEFQDADAQ